MVARTAPGQSSVVLALSFRLSGMHHRVMQTTMSARGRLMKKTQRQEPFCTSQPPSTGPMEAVMAVKPDQVPIARPRSLSEYEALMMARLPGTRNAAPIPCRPRAKTREAIEGAKPHQADP